MATAVLIFVALDDRCRPVPVPPVMPETENEKVRYREAEERYRQRAEKRAQERATRGAAPGN